MGLRVDTTQSAGVARPSAVAVPPEKPWAAAVVAGRAITGEQLHGRRRGWRGLIRSRGRRAGNQHAYRECRCSNCHRNLSHRNALLQSENHGLTANDKLRSNGYDIRPVDRPTGGSTMSAQSGRAAISRCVQTRFSIPAAIAGVVGCPPASLIRVIWGRPKTDKLHGFKLTHYPVDQEFGSEQVFT